MRRKMWLAGALGLIACSGVWNSASADEPQSAQEVVALARRMIAAFEANDMKVAASLVADVDLAIIDNFPPFVWRGKDAFARWLEDMDRNAQALLITHTTSQLGAVKFVRMEGDRAYVAIVDDYRYERAGAAVREDLLWTFVAQKTGQDWKLVSWSFGGGAAR